MFDVFFLFFLLVYGFSISHFSFWRYWISLTFWVRQFFIINLYILYLMIFFHPQALDHDVSFHFPLVIHLTSIALFILSLTPFQSKTTHTQLIWWRSTAYMCEQSFSYQTQLQLSQVGLRWGWSWVGVLTIPFSWWDKKHKILPNQTIPT